MRFPAELARWHVDQIDRHPTFCAVDYGALSEPLQQEIEDTEERARVLEILAGRDPQDIYYQAWVRLEDINRVMRLQD